MSDEGFSWWACPLCGDEAGSNPADSGQYYYVNAAGEIVDCTGFDEKKMCAYPNPPEGFEAYPKYEDEWPMSEGGTQWEEVHLCPICRQEYSFGNASQ